MVLLHMGLFLASLRIHEKALEEALGDPPVVSKQR
jgi:hypothetical protein